MSIKNKIIESTITAECGLFSKVPKNYKRYNSLLIKFDKLANNSLKVTLVFDETHYSKEDAEKIGQDLVKQIALSSAVFNKINFSWRYNISSRWKEKGEKMASVTTSLTLCYRTAINVNVSNNFKIPDKLVDAFSFFNDALKNKEIKRQKETAFLLYITIESLIFSCGINKHSFKKEVVENKIVTRKEIDALNFSLGRYYRHHTASGKGAVISIEKCTDLVRKILYFYDKKLSKK